MKFKIFSGTLLILSTAFFFGCEKDNKPQTPTPPPPVQSASWLENFTDAGALGGKGWVITNNTDKPGPEAWRRGRYESTNKYTLGFDYVVGFLLIQQSVHHMILSALTCMPDHRLQT